RIHWHYVRDDALFSTIKVVSRHQATQKYGTILPIELTSAEIRKSKAYQEYYACAMGEAAPKPKASAKKKKEQLKIVLKRSRQETHISQQSGSGTDEGTGSKPRVPDVPSDDLEEELSWKSSDDEEVALDKALVPSAQRLWIGRSNFRLPSDIQSKEPTLQVVYDVLRNSPFFKAFLVTADVPEIYMQEFWATAKLHQHSIRFKMDTKKHEILEFFRFLGHSTQIKTLTDVNVNKLYQPWRSFAAVINKCLTGKSSGIDSLRISQAQILWGLYHGSNVNNLQEQQLQRNRQMSKEHNPNSSRFYSNGADKRRTYLSNMVLVQMKELVLDQRFRMYHLMTQRKNCHENLSMMKMWMSKLRVEKRVKEIRLMKVLTMMMRKKLPRL
nr:hypothetical protein [Tanacetum cinerariifolium]